MAFVRQIPICLNSLVLTILQQAFKSLLARMWRKGNPLTLLVAMQAGAATLENSMDVLREVKNKATL